MQIEPFKLERYYTLYEHSSQYSLCNSDCESMTIKELLDLEEGATERFHSEWLGYTETKGNPQLRDNITALYEQMNSNDITVCIGAQEPIFLISHAILNSGDEVIVQSPCYQSLHSVPDSMACKVVEWNVRNRNGAWYYDLQSLKKLITKKTKAIFLNAPHNPTGYLFSAKDQQEIVSLARMNDIIIVSDEVYRELEYNEEDGIPAFADIYENAVSIGVMSKAYGLAGLRIGWIASRNQGIHESLAILKEYTSICNPGPSEFLAGVALRNRKSILKRNKQIIQTNLKYYDAFFQKYSHLFSWTQPIAGPVAFVEILLDIDDMVLAQDVLQQKSVLILPGGIYDYPGFFRIGLGRKGIADALHQFEEYVQSHLLES